MGEADDAQARKARADAIRRARDERNARIQSGSDSAEDAGTDADEQEGGGEASDSPNYVDLIDQQMRRDQRNDR